MSINRATYLEDDEDEVVQEIAGDRKWSLSQTIAELVREAPTFKQYQKPVESAKPDVDAN